MVTFPLTHNAFKERITRFLEAGAPPPEGVTIEGRWFTAGHNKGYMLVDTDDAKLLFQFASEWADVIDFEIEPVLTDKEAGAILAGMI